MRRRLVARHRGVAAAAVLLFAVPLGIVQRTSYRDQELLRLQRDTVAATRAIDVGRDPATRSSCRATRDPLAVYDRAGRRSPAAARPGAGRVRAALRTAPGGRRRTAAGSWSPCRSLAAST